MELIHESNSPEEPMSLDDFIQELIRTGEYDCSCHINPPCSFCTDEVQRLYDNYLEELNDDV